MLNNEDSPVDLKWTSHPLKDYPRSSLILIIFIVIMAISLWKIAVVIWEMPLFYYIGLTLFLLSLITYFIPTRYELSDHKITIFYLMIKVEKRYTDFGCYYQDNKGIMLGTFKKPRRLDPFRGTSLRFSKTRAEKEELLSILERKIGNKY
jgi:hypothetical protein